jgi:hypothetical protein
MHHVASACHFKFVPALVQPTSNDANGHCGEDPGGEISIQKTEA